MEEAMNIISLNLRELHSGELLMFFLLLLFYSEKSQANEQTSAAKLKDFTALIKLCLVKSAL